MGVLVKLLLVVMAAPLAGLAMATFRVVAEPVAQAVRHEAAPSAGAPARGGVVDGATVARQRPANRERCSDDLLNLSLGNVGPAERDALKGRKCD